MKQVLNTSLAILITGVLSVAGCYSPATENKAIPTLTGETGKPLIAIIPGAESPEFLQRVRAGAETAGREFGFDIGWNPAKDKNSVTAQSKHVYNVIEKKPAGIVLSPMHRVSLLSAVNRSSKVRVPVVLIDNNVDTNFRLSFIGTDHEQAGVLAARHIGKMIGGKGKVGVITTSPVESSELRVQSFEKTIAAEFSGIQVVKSTWKFADNAPAVNQVLIGHSDLQAIFIVEDFTSNVLAQLREHNATGKVRVVASGAYPVSRQALERGVIDALLVSNPHKMGYESVKAIAEYRDNRRPPKRIDTGIAIITKENINAPENRNLLAPQ